MSKGKRLITYLLNGRLLTDPFQSFHIELEQKHRGGILGQLTGQGFLKRGQDQYDADGALIVHQNTYQLTMKGVSWMKQDKAPAQYQGTWPVINR